MQLSQFNASASPYTENLKKYHGKDIVHSGSNLILDPKIAWDLISGKTRNKIRKAQKNEQIRIERVKGTEDDITAFRTVWFDPDDETLPAHLEEDEIMYLAYENDTLIGGLILTPSGNNLYMHNLGSSREGKKLHIAELLLWNAVKDLKDSKYKYIDVGVSFRKNLQDFFVKFKTDSYPIIFEAPFIRPSITLTPFQNSSMDFEKNESKRGQIDNILKEYLGAEFTFLPTSMFALKAILTHLKLDKNDQVGLLKTFENENISAEITSSIEEICQWKQEITDKTKAILIIHEFGFQNPKTKEIIEKAKTAELPVIEYCAWSIDSKIDGKRIGNFGNYAIYDLPKIFPIQYGAILKGAAFSDQEVWDTFHCLDYFKNQVIKEYLSEYFPKIEKDSAKRRGNFQYLKKLFSNEGYECLIDLDEETIPGTLILKTPQFKDWHEKLQKFSIQSIVYKEAKSLCLPIHQNLSKAHLNYLFAVIRGDLNLCNTYRRKS